MTHARNNVQRSRSAIGRRNLAKGKEWQRESKKLLDAAGIPSKVTAGIQAGDDQSFPDVTGYHPSGLTLAIECKWVRGIPSASTSSALKQADAAYPGLENVAPLVFARTAPGDGVFIMRRAVLFDLLARIQPTGEASQ